MKTKLHVFLSTSLLLAALIPAMVNAGNVKKVYINVAKEGSQATASDLGTIQSQYGQIEGKFSDLIYDYSGFGTSHGKRFKAKTIEGKYGKAVEAIGTIDAYIQYPDNINWANLNEFTVESWLKWTDTSTMPSYARWSSAGGMTVWMGKSGDGFHFATNTNRYRYWNFGAGLNDGKWHHYAVAWKKGSPIQFYVDGNLTSIRSTNTDGNSETYALAMASFGSGLIMGGNWWDGSSRGVGHYDEVRIWNRALDANQIKENMNGPLKATAAQYGLIANFTFDSLAK